MKIFVKMFVAVVIAASMLGCESQNVTEIVSSQEKATAAGSCVEGQEMDFGNEGEIVLKDVFSHGEITDVAAGESIGDDEVVVVELPENVSVRNANTEAVYMEEQVYATATIGVFVRSGPSTEYDVVGALNYCDSITRTGFADNGWSKVDFNGQIAYVCSDYLTVTLPARNAGVDTVGAVDNVISETVYAVTGLNVRSGPGTEYDVVGGLKYRDSVTRTGFADNGWSKVDFNGQIAYVCSDYLTVTLPAAKLGTTGRLTIPSVGVDVALYHCSSSSEYVSEQQRIVDAVDSAAYLPQGSSSGVLIADHKHQGFNAMKASVPYETVAYIDFGSHIQEYICIGIGVGKNLGNDMVDWDGVSLNYGYIKGGLAMYTCNENSTNITISYWQAV